MNNMDVVRLTVSRWFTELDDARIFAWAHVVDAAYGLRSLVLCRKKHDYQEHDEYSTDKYAVLVCNKCEHMFAERRCKHVLRVRGQVSSNDNIMRREQIVERSYCIYCDKEFERDVTYLYYVLNHLTHGTLIAVRDDLRHKTTDWRTSRFYNDVFEMIHGLEVSNNYE